jgi:putative ATP-dependent endonuclease of OLD family
LSRTSHEIELDFSTFEPSNYYRSMRPVLIEDGVTKSPSEIGQGMRNLVVLALFRTYAKIFRGDAIIAVEEPETYLHPHAQRSLAAIFDELAEQGNQIFYSTHSGNFVDVHHFDRICLVDKCPDIRGKACSQVRQVSATKLLTIRQKLHSHVRGMTVQSMRERYRNFYGLEHNEAFFARKIVLVEGESEEYALPIYAKALGYDFDANGVSVVKARGKSSLDAFYQLYTSFRLPTYIVFDNDRGGKERDLRQNETLLRMLNEVEEREPDGVVRENYAVLEGNYEKEMAAFVDDALGPGVYSEYMQEASEALGPGVGKGLQARFMAQQLVEEGIIPSFIEDIVEAVCALGEAESAEESPLKIDFDDLPF